jgi:hypothetical protein
MLNTAKKNRGKYWEKLNIVKLLTKL